MAVAILWFRKSLRLHDNPSLTWVCNSDEITTIIPIYIFEDDISKSSNSRMGENRLRFQFECVENLHQNLDSKLGLHLQVFSGDPLLVFQSIDEHFANQEICLVSEYCSDQYNREQYQTIENKIINQNPTWSSKSFPAGHTILDIEAIIKSPDYKPPNSMKDMLQIFNREFGDYNDLTFPISDVSPPVHQSLETDLISSPYTTTLEKIKMNLSPRSYFVGGETEAMSRFEKKVNMEKEFVNNFNKPKSISTNLESNPMEPSTTGLSPYISTGCLSIRRFWNACTAIHQSNEHTIPPVSMQGQILFREMFYLLSRSVDNWDKSSNNTHCKDIDWGETNQPLLDAWETGQTGFPLIDAMMRQLDSTGWMHHLGRHAVSCFLTRGQLWQNWTHGRDIFERKLIDSDWALNNGNWLWLAGVAPFSMPYYRIYNPCPDSKSSLNVETENADFIRHWIPELATFPSKYIFEPHLAPLDVQESANCIIGIDYPNPIVDRKTTRRENLQSFKLSLAK